MKKLLVKPIYLVVLFFFTAWESHAQKKDSPTVEDLLQKTVLFYESQPTYSVDLTYRLFRDTISPKTIEEYGGLFQKQGKNTYLKIDQTEFLNNERASLKVNHDQKAMLFSSPKNEAQAISLSPLQIRQYLKSFSKKEVYSSKGAWVCKLSTPIFTQLPYGTIWIFINKKTYAIEKQRMELTAPKGYKDEKGNFTMHRKYLEIVFSNFSETLENSARLKLSNYVHQRNGEVTVTGTYKDYDLYTTANQ
ncbi:MAG: hypothetical protein CMC74_02875 [Flavobacteriaceae bacterium]|nr:hypothetical protein [Flavobacteriaceae bacterium]|tara:strand:- start:48733 stop:49476 length:744 start_codon:yes stop_codon:yes gene_type:complete